MQEDERHELEGTTSYEAVMAADDWQKNSRIIPVSQWCQFQSKESRGSQILQGSLCIVGPMMLLPFLRQKRYGYVLMSPLDLIMLSLR